MKTLRRIIYGMLAFVMVFVFNLTLEYETLAVEKMSEELMEIMGIVSNTTPFSVTIELKDKVPQEQLNKALDEVYKEYDMDTFYASEADYIGNDKAYQEAYPELLAHSDAYAAARREVLASFYYPHNYAFLDKYDLKVEDKSFVGVGVAYIHYVVVNKEIVNKMLYDPDVVYIMYLPSENEGDFGDTVSQAMQYVRGDINDLGVTGNGIKVGLIEEGSPLNSSNLDYIHPLVSGYEETEHATQTTEIIRLLSPNCDIYVYPLGSQSHTSTEVANIPVFDTSKVWVAFDDLYGEGVHVINMSYGQLTNLSNLSATNLIDKLVDRYKIPFVVASGNANAESTLEHKYVVPNYNTNIYGAGYNSICVGGIMAPGSVEALNSYYSYMNSSGEEISSSYNGWTSAGPMELYVFSCKNDISTIRNRPDLVAPAGLFTIAGKHNVNGTSFAAPHVTSAIAWMLARNVYMQQKPEQIKAAVIGSAYTRNNDVVGVVAVPSNPDYPNSSIWQLSRDVNLLNSQSKFRDHCGAGVLNAAYCYNIAYLGRRAEFTFTAQGQSKTYNVSVSNNGQPFRVGIAWNAQAYTINEGVLDNDVNSSYEHDDTLDFRRNFYTLSIRKQGASSDIVTENQTSNLFQAITLDPETISQLGGGTYTVTITCTNYVEANDVVGMTWNNLNPLGYAPYNKH